MPCLFINVVVNILCCWMLLFHAWSTNSHHQKLGWHITARCKYYTRSVACPASWPVIPEICLFNIWLLAIVSSHSFAPATTVLPLLHHTDSYVNPKSELQRLCIFIVAVLLDCTLPVAPGDSGEGFYINKRLYINKENASIQPRKRLLYTQGTASI